MRIYCWFPRYAPTRRNLRRLAEALDVTLDQFHREGADDYPPDVTIARLRRLRDLGAAQAILKKPIRKLTRKERLEVLRAIEAQLREEFVDDGRELR